MTIEPMRDGAGGQRNFIVLFKDGPLRELEIDNDTSELVRTELSGPDGTLATVTSPLQEALALDRQPHHDLMALYQGWMDCLTAAEAARITGRFRLTTDPTQAAEQRGALRECHRLEQETIRLRNQAANERQIAKQVDLNLALQRLLADLSAARARL